MMASPTKEGEGGGGFPPVTPGGGDGFALVSAASSAAAHAASEAEAAALRDELADARHRLTALDDELSRARAEGAQHAAAAAAAAAGGGAAPAAPAADDDDDLSAMTELLSANARMTALDSMHEKATVALQQEKAMLLAPLRARVAVTSQW